MRTLEKPFTAILADAWTVYSKNFKFIVVLVALTFVPIFVFRTFLPEHLYLANQRFLELASGYFAGEVDFATLVAGLTSNALLYEVLHFGIFLVFFPLLVAGTVYLSRHHLCAADPDESGCPHCKNEPPSFDNMFANIFTPFPKMIVTAVLVASILFFLTFFLAGFLSGFLLFIPVIIGVNMIFFMQFTADVGRWGLGATSLSRYLIRGRWLKTFITAVLLAIPYFAIIMVSNIAAPAIIESMGINPLFELPIFLITHLILTIFPIIFALWYFELKRLKKSDLERLEQLLMDTLHDAMDRVKQNMPKRPFEGNPDDVKDENNPPNDDDK